MNGTKGRLTVGLILTVSLAILPGAYAQRSSKSDVSPHLNLLGFVLEKNTLADVESKLGASTPGSCSDDAEPGKMICYVSERSDKTKIFFESGPSGGRSKLDGFRVISGDLKAACGPQCMTAVDFGGDIQTGGGLKLGLTKVELTALLGPPKAVKGNRLTFEWSSLRPMTSEEINRATQTFKSPVARPYFDVLDIIEVTIRKSKITEFEVHHTVTY